VVRDELPAARPYAPLYRTPICVNVDTGAIFVGR